MKGENEMERQLDYKRDLKVKMKVKVITKLFQNDNIGTRRPQHILHSMSGKILICLQETIKMSPVEIIRHQ